MKKMLGCLSLMTLSVSMYAANTTLDEDSFEVILPSQMEERINKLVGDEECVKAILAAFNQHGLDKLIDKKPVFGIIEAYEKKKQNSASGKLGAVQVQALKNNLEAKIIERRQKQDKGEDDSLIGWEVVTNEGRGVGEQPDTKDNGILSWIGWS